MRIPQEVLQKANATSSSTKPVAHAISNFDLALGVISLAVLAYSVVLIAEASLKTIKRISVKKLLRRVLGMALILVLVKYETLGTSEVAGKNIGIDEIFNAMGALSLDVFIGAGLVSWVMM